jgi:predicted AlkP superfamily pyrophosphatase or phosphodiesterase
MINEKSVRAVGEAKYLERFRRPLYDSYCFSQIPGTVEKLLTGRGKGLPDDACRYGSHDAVVLLFVDAFGWRFFERYKEKFPFLKQFVADGIATKITSQFPSTTAPHVTCINTGLPVGESGIYEWFYYEPKVDNVIVPLLYTFAGNKVIGALEKTGIQPTDIFPTKTLYQKLKGMGIDSYVVHESEIIDSHYSRVLLQGAHPVSFDSVDEGLTRLAGLIEAPQKNKSYYFFYFGGIDSAGHHQGIYSPAFEQEVENWWRSVERVLWPAIQKSSKKIATLVIADHGMTEVSPERTFYLNEELPQLLPMIQTNRAGELIVPAGSCRDFFLHLRPDAFAEAEHLLRSALAGRAEVIRTETLIQEGFFGLHPPSKEFLSRVGNLVILPHVGEAVWWHEKGKFNQAFYGAHGGLTPNEMESIFLFID